MDFSIVIPVFNEAKKVPDDILDAETFLKEQDLKGEIIVVDDGSTDGGAKVAENTVVDPAVQKRVLHLEANMGKGNAVRDGIMVSRGTYVMFCDSGRCIDYKFAKVGLEMLKNGECDIAHASRKLASSKIMKPQTVMRRFTSKLFRFYTVAFLHIPPYLTDTQCGFKLYKGDVARDLYTSCKTQGFSFDIEVVLRAQKKGYIIKEFPVEWYSDPDTRLLPNLIYHKVFSDLNRIKREVR